MRRAAFLIVVIAIFVVMALVVIFREMTGEESGGGFRGFSMAVATAEVTEREFADIVTALGTARANESVAITAKVSDTISRIGFDSGERVVSGQVLIEQTDREEAAALNEARATRREAQQEQERFRDLAERGIAPSQRVQETQAALDRAIARVGAVEARMADRIIRAPFDGRVGLRNISVGELVGPGDVIATLDDDSVIKLDFTVPERFFAALEAGIPLRARSDAYPDRVFEGVIAEVETRIDPVTRSVIVRAEIPNPDGLLRPGMFMTVEIRRGERVRPAIPEGALIRVSDDAFVYVVVETETGHSVQRRPVDVGLRTSGVLEILSGLEAGEQVVSEGTHRVQPGMPVQIAGAQAAPGGRP
jgi:membrane fusion protein, multidrug efflux system